MGSRRDHLVKSIVEVCQKIADKGWVANHDGNVSARFDDMLLATPTATSKADIVPEMILTLDMAGKKLQGIGKPFSEINLHLAAYRARPDIQAVVHAHPPFAMARGLLGQQLEVAVPEAIVSIGAVIPVARYALPGAAEHDEIIAQALAGCDVFMMAGNGALSAGRDVKEAYLRMELLEHLAKIDHYLMSMGTGTPLVIPAEDKQELLEKRAALGLGPKSITAPPAAEKPADSKELLKDLIAQEIKKVFKEE